MRQFFETIVPLVLIVLLMLFLALAFGRPHIFNPSAPDCRVYSPEDCIVSQ